MAVQVPKQLAYSNKYLQLTSERAVTGLELLPGNRVKQPFRKCPLKLLGGSNSAQVAFFPSFYLQTAWQVESAQTAAGLESLLMAVALSLSRAPWGEPCNLWVGPFFCVTHLSGGSRDSDNGFDVFCTIGSEVPEGQGLYLSAFSRP